MEFSGIEGAVTFYASTSKVLADKKETLANLQAEFDEQNKELVESISSINDRVNETKDYVKIEAENKFKETGDKKLYGGIGIRETTSLTYDKEEAIVWCKEKMPVAIEETVNKKMFESYAKENELEFVNKDKKVTVTFPKEIII